MGRWLKGLLVGLLVASMGIGLAMSPIGSTFEMRVGLPWLFYWRGPVTPPGEVVVVAMDSRTGEQLDLPTLPRYWPRSIHASLVDQLVARGASVIVFDVHFGREKESSDDQLLVDAVRRAGNVVLVELLTGKHQPISDQQGRHVGMVWSEERIPPFAALEAAATGLATFPLPKEGASVSQLWVFKQSTDDAPTMPAVALQLYAREQAGKVLELARAVAAEDFAGLPQVEAAFSDPQVLRNFMRGMRAGFLGAGEKLGDFETTSPSEPPILLEQALEFMYAGNANRFVNFYGPPGTISTVPYHAVIKGSDPNVPDDMLDFSGKVVFIGYSDMFDPGQPDRFYTVYTREDGVDLSGVEIAATGFANLLTNRSLAPVSTWGAFGIFAGFGLMVGLLVYILPAYIGVPVALLLGGGFAFLAQAGFERDAMIWPVATPLLVQAPMAVFIGLLAQYLLERQRGQRISDAINYYLPDDIARDLTRRKLQSDNINQVLFGTCLATDMVGFSTVAEQMPPGELAAYLNDYFETLAAPLKRHDVHVTEFRADAIMCAWTAKESGAHPRRQALLAALEAGAAIHDFKGRHEIAEGRLRIGLEAGEVYVGHAGGGGRFVYSIVGDTANTASRVEGLNKHLHTQILATGEVVEGFDDILTRYLGTFQFVGKQGGIPVYEVVALRHTATPRQLELCERFIELQRRCEAGDWADAAKGVEDLLQVFPGDGPSEFLLARCRDALGQLGATMNPAVIRMDRK